MNIKNLFITLLTIVFNFIEQNTNIGLLKFDTLHYLTVYLKLSIKIFCLDLYRTLNGQSYTEISKKRSSFLMVNGLNS